MLVAGSWKAWNWSFGGHEHMVCSWTLFSHDFTSRPFESKAAESQAWCRDHRVCGRCGANHLSKWSRHRGVTVHDALAPSRRPCRHFWHPRCSTTPPIHHLSDHTPTSLSSCARPTVSQCLVLFRGHRRNAPSPTPPIPGPMSWPRPALRRS